MNQRMTESEALKKPCFVRFYPLFSGFRANFIYCPPIVPKLRGRFFYRFPASQSAPIQGTAADIIKLAMIKVYRRLKSENLDARLILQVHDELIVEAHKSCAETAARLLKEEMENCVKMSVPLTVDVKVGKTWFDTH